MAFNAPFAARLPLWVTNSYDLAALCGCVCRGVLRLRACADFDDDIGGWQVLLGRTGADYAWYC